MAVLMVQAFGFPLFKLRASLAGAGQQGVFRDFEQAAGHAPVAANRRQGTLAVYLDDPPPWLASSGGSFAVGRDVGGCCLGRRPDRRGGG